MLARLRAAHVLLGAAIVLVACGELRVAQVADTDPPDEATEEEEGDGSTASTKDAATSKDAGKDAGKSDSSPPPVVCDGPCPPQELATGLLQATAITVDAVNVYFAIEGNSGMVYQCPKTGCVGPPIELGTGYTTSIVVAGGVVYWGDFSAGKLQSCAVGGCGKLPTAVVSNQPSFKGTVTDDVDLFWATNGTIKHCTRTTCSNATEETITTGQGFVRSLAAEQNKVIWPSGNSIYVCPNGPCASPTVLGPGTGDVSIHAGVAYWVNGATKNVVRCPLSGCNQSPITIGSSQSPMFPVSDGTHVYWRDGFYDNIYRCSATGCNPGPDVIAKNQRGQPGGQIALDGQYVYWTTTSGVYRLPK